MTENDPSCCDVLRLICQVSNLRMSVLPYVRGCCFCKLGVKHEANWGSDGEVTCRYSGSVD